MRTCTLALVAAFLLALPAPAVNGAVVSARVHAALAGPEDSAAVWVYFADKGPGATPAALAAIEHEYDPRAVARRRLRRTAPGLFDERDLPLERRYVAEVLATGARLRTEARWLNAVSVEATAGQVEQLASLSCVDRIDLVRRARRATWIPRSEPDEGSFSGGFYGAAQAQLEQIGVTDLHADGYTGAGVIVGVLDTGFNRTHDAYNEPGHVLQVVAEWDFVNGDGNTGPEPGDLANQHDHGTEVLGCIGAYDPFNLVGGAYDASFVLAKSEDLASEYLLEEDFFVAGLQFIEANGGDVATSSLVIRFFYDEDDLDGQTSVMAQGFNTATENGVHCFQGAGNEGHDSNPATIGLLHPADAFEVVTVGAVDSSGDIASFSSDGPTADGRRKPEVLARGVATVTVHPSADSVLVGVNGTSFATPLTAAAAACLVQKHPSWTVAEMRMALIATASDYVANGFPDAEYVRGYGIVDAHAASIPPSEPGTRYCSPAVPNSRGGSGRLRVTGSPVVAADDLVLWSHALPIESNIGYFLMGTGQNVFTPPGSIGPLCVAPGLRRFLPPVANTDQLPGGFFRRVGTSTGVAAQITPGSTWNFQAWHRDTAAGTSNLTDAVSIDFL